MPVYRILIQGSGIEVPAEEESTVFCGFSVTCVAEAPGEQEASAIALSRVAGEWSQGRYAPLNATPTLRVAEVSKVGVLSRWLAKDTAYTLHASVM